MVPFNRETHAPSLHRFSGDYRIDKILLDDVDVTNLYGQLDIYENLVGAIYAVLSMVDTNGIIYGNYPARNPILGGEKVRIVADGVTYGFRVYRVVDRAPLNPTTTYFTLMLVSEDGFINHHSSLSRGFSQMRHHEMVQSIYERDMGGKRDLVVHEITEARENYVAPNIPPLAAANAIAYRSVSAASKYRTGQYLFFETSAGWHFVPYEMLLDQEQNVSYCKMSMDTVRATGKSQLVSYDDRTAEDYVTIDDYSFINVVETKQHADMGLYAAHGIFSDMSVKPYVDRTTKYVDDYYDMWHSPYRPEPAINQQVADDLQADVNTRWDVITEYSGLFSKDAPNRSRPSLWYLKRRSLAEQSQMFNMKVTTGMVPALRAGMAVDIRLPKISSEDMRHGRSDEKYSGRFIITALRRTWKNNDNAFITMTVMKDGLDQQIPFAL